MSKDTYSFTHLYTFVSQAIQLSVTILAHSAGIVCWHPEAHTKKQQSWANATSFSLSPSLSLSNTASSQSSGADVGTTVKCQGQVLHECVHFKLISRQLDEVGSIFHRYLTDCRNGPQADYGDPGRHLLRVGFD